MAFKHLSLDQQFRTPAVVAVILPLFCHVTLLKPKQFKIFNWKLTKHQVYLQKIFPKFQLIIYIQKYYQKLSVSLKKWIIFTDCPCPTVGYFVKQKTIQVQQLIWWHHLLNMLLSNAITTTLVNLTLCFRWIELFTRPFSNCQSCSGVLVHWVVRSFSPLHYLWHFNMSHCLFPVSQCWVH